MRKLFLPLTVVAFVVACAPRDVPKEDGRGGGSRPNSNNSNKTLTYFVDEVGQTPPSCTSKNNWGVLEIPQSDADEILSGNIKAVILAGNGNCFKIGARVEIKFFRTDDEVLGYATITSAKGLSLNDIRKADADAFGMTATALKERGKTLIDEAKNRPEKPYDAQGMVTITTFELEGAPSGNLSTEPSDDKTTFSTDGERPSTCTDEKDWSFITVPFGFNMDRTIMAVIDRGDKNCLRIGSTVNVKYKTENGTLTESEDQVKIVAVEVVPSASIGFAHVQLLGMPLESIKTFYAKNLGHETVSMVYFTKQMP